MTGSGSAGALVHSSNEKGRLHTLSTQRGENGADSDEGQPMPEPGTLDQVAVLPRPVRIVSVSQQTHFWQRKVNEFVQMWNV